MLLKVFAHHEYLWDFVFWWRSVSLYLHFTAPFQIAALRKGASMISQQLVFNPIAQNAAIYLGTLQVTVLTNSTQFDMRGLQVRPFNNNIPW